ncbi:hypothetical protein WEI85_06205 [Actinomycetes bacterium KLBMP 9797]
MRWYAALTGITTLAGLLVAAPATAAPARSSMDIDGDGKDELVAGAYLGTEGYGIVVTYSRLARRDRFALPSGAGQIGSQFGQPLTSGDFNADGYADLVVGDPEERLAAGPSYSAGGLWVFSGGPSGLNLSQPLHLNQDTAGMPGAMESYDWFGGALAAGDLNGDGRDDLAVSARGDKVNGHALAGSVTVLFGSAAGLTTAGAQLATQDTPGVPGAIESSDGFGVGLAVGDMTRDGYADLAVGAPRDGDWSEPYEHGTITLLRGSASGVSETGATSVTGVELGIGSIGHTMSIADIDGDGDGDLVAGAPRQDIGYLVYIPGVAGGLDVPQARIISMNTPGVPGTPRPYLPEEPSHLGFGHSVATGDVTGDGRADVLTSARGHEVNGQEYAGAIFLIPGTASGLTGAGSLMLTQHRQGPLRPGRAVPSCQQPGRWDFFGDANAILNLDGSGALDMVTASKWENFSNGMVMRVGFQHAARRTASGRLVRVPVALATTSCQSDPGVGHSLLHQ